MADERSLYWCIDFDFQQQTVDLCEGDSLDAAMMMSRVLRKVQKTLPLHAFIFNHRIVESCYNIHDGVAHFWRVTIGYDVHALVKVVNACISEVELREQLQAAVDKSVSETGLHAEADMFKCFQYTLLTKDGFVETRHDDYAEAVVCPHAMADANVMLQ